MLDYDEDDNAYVVNITKEQLRSAPADSIEALTKDAGVRYRDRAFEYYKTPRYWERS
jgi:hypothetical protein